MWGLVFRGSLVMLLLAAAAGPGRAADAPSPSKSPFSRRIKVAPFPDDLQWVNTAAPLELAELRGKFVLLDFWTYCCINCMHVLPELKKLEKAYPDQLLVIGVHSAKFDGEKDAANVAEAVARHNIEHPVVNDSQMLLWNRFGVSSWPTLILIDPQGYAVWGNRGEVTFERLDQVLKPAIAFYKRKGLLDETPLKLGLKIDRPGHTPLRFPGKVLADEQSNRLFIADSNHNRIVITRLDGSLLDVIGPGTAGRADGDYATAQFQQPQGMALDRETLYVADTENHLLRKVDLLKKRVTTIAGLGHQARGIPPQGRTSPALQTALSSPWALCLHNGDLYVAMAGWHQLWWVRLRESAIGLFAGNGLEDVVDGPLAAPSFAQPGFASFAQPSGLSSDGEWLYVADSEGSSIRAVPLGSGKAVRTVVGTSHLPYARLFNFGDVDGRGRDVRLQHPLGVVCYQGKLYVADTYNNKIKQIDPQDGTTRTIAGTGKPGSADDPARFDEPAGISAAAGKLFVADTNNHSIRVINLKSGNKVTTLPVKTK